MCIPHAHTVSATSLLTVLACQVAVQAKHWNLLIRREAILLAALNGCSSSSEYLYIRKQPSISPSCSSPQTLPWPDLVSPSCSLSPRAKLLGLSCSSPQAAPLPKLLLSSSSSFAQAARRLSLTRSALLMGGLAGGWVPQVYLPRIEAALKGENIPASGLLEKASPHTPAAHFLQHTFYMPPVYTSCSPLTSCLLCTSCTAWLTLWHMAVLVLLRIGCTLGACSCCGAGGTIDGRRASNLHASQQVHRVPSGSCR